MTTRGRARANGLARLRAAGDDSAALAADLLLAHACGVAKEELYSHLDAALGPEEERLYRELVERRAAGEPVAYLRGWKEFFGLRFAVDARVLVPRPETETLVEAALAFLRDRGGTRVVDVGTGSGAVAIAIAVSAPRSRVIATDVSPGALEIARANMTAHAVEDRLELRAGDLLEPVEEEVDVITANLPYLPIALGLRPRRLDPARGSSLGPAVPGVPADPEGPWGKDPDPRSHLSFTERSLLFEPREAVLAGGSDGLDVIRRCVAQVPSRLARGGAAFFECDPPQAAAVAELLGARLGGPTRILRDLMGNERVVEGIRG
ncbi:MAG: N5-glutamine methyltransferase family protein [Candidatus Limnocylindria bacterium]